MILINLLPVRTKKREEGDRLIAAAYLLTVFLALAIIALVDFTYSRMIATREQELSAVQTQVKAYHVYQVKLDQLTNRKKTIDQKREVIKQLQSDRDAVVRMLGLLSIKIPVGKIWFNSLTQNGDTVSLDGVAESNEAIATFMRNLQDSPYVEAGSTNLVVSKQIQISDMKLRTFQLAYRFRTYSQTQKK
ncbi:MAG: PilN domain-containing protein [Syntrophobacteraceae bacterium]